MLFYGSSLFIIPNWSKHPNFFTAKTVSTFVKTKVLTEISISTLGFPVSRTVKP